MLQSHIIEIDGVFVGAAVRLDRGFRFIATDMRLDDIDGSIWCSLTDVQRVARRTLTSTTHSAGWRPALTTTGNHAAEDHASAEPRTVGSHA